MILYLKTPSSQNDTWERIFFETTSVVPHVGGLALTAAALDVTAAAGTASLPPAKRRSRDGRGGGIATLEIEPGHQAATARLFERIAPETVFVQVIRDGIGSGVGTGVLAGEWLGIFHIATIVEHRRQVSEGSLSMRCCGGRLTEAQGRVTYRSNCATRPRSRSTGVLDLRRTPTPTGT